MEASRARERLVFMGPEHLDVGQSVGPGRSPGRVGVTMAMALLIAMLCCLLLAQAGLAAAGGRDVVLHGTLLVAHADRRLGAEDSTFYLLKASGGYLDLKFDRAPKLKPNQGVQVSGV